MAVYLAYAFAVWSWLHGADVRIESEAGPVLGLRNTDDICGVELRCYYRDPATGAMVLPPFPDYSVARLTNGGIVHQSATTWAGIDENGNPGLLQDNDFCYWSLAYLMK